MKRAQKLISDLDSNRFAVRAAAAKDLAALGDLAEPGLRKALEDRPSAEVQKRVEALLTALRTAPPGETVRALRVIQVLERIGTPEAQQALRKLAAGAKEARRTQDAKEALERLARQRVRKP